MIDPLLGSPLLNKQLHTPSGLSVMGTTAVDAAAAGAAPCAAVDAALTTPCAAG